jgi:hypothetical protein
MNELSKELKDLTVATYKKFGEDKGLVTRGKAYTGNEVAYEIENETELGMNILRSLLSLSIDLIKRQKESLDEVPPTRDGGDYVVKN